MPRERGYVPEDGALHRGISRLCSPRIISMSVSGWSGYVPRSAEPTECRIVAASKTVPAEAVNYAASLGLRAFGENRVQEFCDKEPLLSPPLERHFIRFASAKQGQISSSGRTSLIHSVDSVALAEEISKRANARRLCSGYSRRAEYRTRGEQERSDAGGA